MIKKIMITFICLMSSLMSLGGDDPKVEKNQELKIPALEKRLAFARDLEKQQDFYRAITEYKRQQFQHLDKSTQRSCHLGIVRCYYEGHKWIALEDACRQALKEDIFNKVDKEILHKVWALALWNLGESSQAHKQLSLISDNKINSHQLKAWIATALGKNEEAQQHFKLAHQTSYMTYLKRGQRKEKSPALAGTMSAVVPGSGQLYTGNKSAALGAFLVNSLLIAATMESFDEGHDVLGSGLSLLATGFYLGNIYGAVNFAHLYNSEKNDDHLAKKSGLAGSYKESVILKINVPF